MQVQWNLAYPNFKYPAAWIIQPQSMCIIFNTHGTHKAKYCLKGGVTTWKCQNFNCPKPEEAEIWGLFSLGPRPPPFWSPVFGHTIIHRIEDRQKLKRLSPVFRSCVLLWTQTEGKRGRPGNEAKDCLHRSTTWQETTVLIMIHCVLIHISGYFTYLAVVWSHCSQISEDPLYWCSVLNLGNYTVYINSVDHWTAKCVLWNR